MAVMWDGFSEEDITKMKSGVDGGDSMYTNNKKFKDIDSPPNGKRKPSLGPVKKLTEEGFPKNGSVLKGKAVDSSSEVSSKCGSTESSAKPVSDSRKFSQDASTGDELGNYDFSSETLQSYKESIDEQKKSLTAKLVLPSLSQPTTAAINLNDFRAKHRLMEEQNRARKVFLAKALEDRKKQTHAEQQRLSMIQEELQKLDQRLSCDVSIIRNQIEAASLEFMEAQKRYDRAEKEFLDAKLLLYTKLERKELLTHHLCTIIEQNEMRKAQKLSELMEKLEMPDSGLHEIHGEKEATIGGMSGPEARVNTSSEIILSPSSVALAQSPMEVSSGEKNNTEM
ncbi:RAB6-interacting golgin [Frankliniella fusca]|uniref:RAB6-interacting golgin n=1 Tax=Frankliniella fusca TaxID=407009 RepID=A0AAE1LHC6_9NEOP|nr:RAB6-interacting golgin [Frankliniella fusca]